MQSSILKSYFNYITIVLIHWQVLVICFTINIARWKILFSKLLCKIEIEFSFLNTIERDGEEIALASWIARVFLSSQPLSLFLPCYNFIFIGRTYWISPDVSICFLFFKVGARPTRISPQWNSSRPRWSYNKYIIETANIKLFSR